MEMGKIEHNIVEHLSIHLPVEIRDPNVTSPKSYRPSKIGRKWPKIPCFCAFQQAVDSSGIGLTKIEHNFDELSLLFRSAPVPYL